MRAHLDLDEEQMKLAAEEEKKRRRQCPRLSRSPAPIHELKTVSSDDVMAHVHTYGLMAPDAAAIIQ